MLFSDINLLMTSPGNPLNTPIKEINDTGPSSKFAHSMLISKAQ